MSAFHNNNVRCDTRTMIRVTFSLNVGFWVWLGCVLTFLTLCDARGIFAGVLFKILPSGLYSSLEASIVAVQDGWTRDWFNCAHPASVYRRWISFPEERFDYFHSKRNFRSLDCYSLLPTLTDFFWGTKLDRCFPWKFCAYRRHGYSSIRVQLDCNVVVERFER